MQRLHQASAVVLVAAGALALAACGSSGGSAASGTSSKSPYTIGYVNDLSGPISVYGQYTLSFLQAIVKETNASGGVDGHKLTVASVDAAAAGATGVSAVKQLLSQDHPIAIYGNNLSDDCGAEASVVAQAQIPMICVSTPVSLLKPVQKYVFAGQVAEPTEGPAVVQLAKELKVPPGAKFATLVAGSLGAEEYASDAAKAAEVAGYKKVAAEVVPLTSVSAGAEISRVVAAKPDVVFIEPVGSQIQPLVQALRAAGNEAPVMDVDYPLTLGLYQTIKDTHLYGDGAANFIDSQTDSQPGVAQIEKMLAKGGLSGVNNLNGAQGPNAALPVLALVDGLKICGGSCTGPQLATSLEKVTLNYKGFVSDYGWTPASHYPLQGISFYVYDPATNLPVLKAADLPLGQP